MNNAGMIAAIDREAVETRSGAWMAFRYTLHQQPEFQELYEHMQDLGFDVKTGWGLMLPIGYNGTEDNEHSDGHNLAIYYPADHSARLVVGDSFITTQEGTIAFVPKGVSHCIESITKEPRFSVVWTLA